MQKNSYDEVQYESKPIVNSKPENLHTVASFFGMMPPSLENARILELGCAGGGNITPIAMIYPDSYCLGVDLSDLQIKHALKVKDHLKVDNIDFICASITDIDESYGKFDYIICHGVFSWVPQEVRTAIFSVCNKLLTENGLAYISYNTMPGWALLSTLRDLMLHYSRNAKKSDDRILNARFIADFLQENIQAESSYSEVLKKEIEKISECSDHYIFHEHLEQTNKQFYFHEFMSEAKSHSLQYAGPAEIFTTFRGNMSEQVSEKLGITDLEEIEQYLDFIYNRRFRSSILCKKEVEINRYPSSDIVKKFFVETKFEASKPLSEIDIYDEKSYIEFYYDGDKEIAFSRCSAIRKAIFYSLSYYWNYPVSFDDILSETCKIASEFQISEIENELCEELFNLIKLGYLSISTTAPNFINKISQKPQLSKLARYQAGKGQKWVTSQMHKVVWINDLERHIYRYLDGKHSMDDVLDKLLLHLENGDITSEYHDKTASRKEIEDKLKNVIYNLQHEAMLVG